MWYPLPINLEVEQPFHLENEDEITDFGHILPDSQILLSSLRNCIFTDTCSILYFFDVLKSYDADSFISGNTVVTRDLRVAPYHRIQKMCVFSFFFSIFHFCDYKVVVGTPSEMRKKQKTPEMNELDSAKKSLKF